MRPLFDPVGYLESVLRLVEANALHWPRVKDTDYRVRYLTQSAGCVDIGAVHALVRAALAELGDQHSHLVLPAPFDPSTKVPKPRGEALGGCAYVVVPAFSQTPDLSAGAYAAMLRQTIADLASTRPRGFIVDLRNNGGGNMWPMLSGLAPLFGDGPIGAFVAPNRPPTVWSILMGTPRLGSTLIGDVPSDAFSVQEPVAVLTSAATASSGEAVAVAFRGWPRARSFGQPTAGLTTANNTFALADGAWLALTTSVFADRTGRLYGAKLVPDVMLPVGSTQTPLGSDPVVDAAIAWLSNVPAVR